jgi:hypothetical protein
MEEASKKSESSLLALIGILASYIFAYLYTFLATHPISLGRTILVIFSLGFCISTEIVYRRKKASWESWIWLISLWFIILGIVTQRTTIWGEYSILFSHAYAVYWLLSRSGIVIARESSIFLPLDIALGFVVFPIKNFFLRLKTLFLIVFGSLKKSSSLTSKVSVTIALLFSIFLLYTAGSLLASADETFHRLLRSVLDFFRIENFEQFVLRFLISIPIGAYLYGLIVGISHESREKWDAVRDQIYKKSSHLRTIPNKIWILILSLFILLYLFFFVLQASYLFGAFLQQLPENFTVAQYARQGFFELCAIMALNFSLLGVIALSNLQPLRDTKQLKRLTTALLLQGVIFAGIAFSKLYLYIQRFGFTPLRLQSTWLTFVLLVGSISALYSLHTGKKSMRLWILFSGVSLSLMNLF